MRLIINGSNGRMGHELISLANAGYRGAELAAAVDINNEGSGYKNLYDFKGEADCIIDFTNHSLTRELTQYAVKNKLPLVIATTGQTEEELQMIDEAAKEIPIFRSANMSVGVALLTELAKTVSRMMPEADIEIIEKHHNRKLDAPSGTALMLADAIKEVRHNAEYVKGRSGNAKRTKAEIGIHAVRLGNIVGEHEVIIGTDTQTITVKHEAHSRALFAEGAVDAAAFLVNCKAGLYNMQDIMKKGE
ncbi:MAG: 4-hydroxy-tetrahydrodipicolinate reductase [Eubacteriales bacterium]|nr:4-hydroxy-tetrahydrodipicolinate reductase [Eubacteriales bacterium]MDD4390971.1 4-hydroxy-tetrahydrodipicolinate reductase [Eubacteriales bacterium]